MKVIYRLCDIESTNPPPILRGSKLALNLYCLDKFVEAFKEVKPEIIFLCDHTRNYDQTLKDNIPFKFSTEYTNGGINSTYLRSFEIAKDLDEDVLFQECDYVYKPDTGLEIVEAIKEFGFISPYDHPDKYPSDNVKLRWFNGRHWRNSPSTTMTYGTTKENIKEHYELLTKHGYLDQQMWLELTATTGKELWTPISTIATHMVASQIAPGMEF